MHNTQSIFQYRLKKARQAKGLTITALAKAAYTSVSSMWHYENGNNIPPLDTAAKIATTLGVSLDYLAGLDNKV